MFSINMISKEDFRIIEELRSDSSRSIRKIAEATGMPVTTVHSHIRKLRREGVIRRYTVEVDMAKLDKPVTAYVLLTADSAYLQRAKVTQDGIADRLFQHPLVDEAVTLTGRYDFMVRIRIKDIKELNDVMVSFIRQVKGIQKTETFLVLHEAGKESRENEKD